jgi:hypothetical protein
MLKIPLSFLSLWPTTYLHACDHSCLRWEDEAHALQLDSLAFQSPQKENGYRSTGMIEKLKDTKELGYSAYLIHLRLLH